MLTKARYTLATMCSVQIKWHKKGYWGLLCSYGGCKASTARVAETVLKSHGFRLTMESQPMAAAAMHIIAHLSS
jgi:hypothetical protein